MPAKIAGAGIEPAPALVSVTTNRPALSPSVRFAIAQLREFYLGKNDGIMMYDNNEPLPDWRNALTNLRELRADGSWPDIDYASRASSGWNPANHYIRMVAMTIAAMRSDAGLAPEQREKLLTGIHSAFKYWIRNDFKCPNWWYNEIGTPKTLGLCAVLLGDQLDDVEYTYVTGTLLSRYPVKRTGQNKIWLAGNALYLAFLRGDEVKIAETSTVIWNEVRVGTSEGIQPDYSFHQHGAQQQFGNYGMSFAVEICRWGLFFRGTPWAMPEGKLAVFRHYLLDGLNWTCWRGVMDISACGRQYMPSSPENKAANISRVMTETALFDHSHSNSYRDFVSRNPILPAAGPSAGTKEDSASINPLNEFIGNKYFWRSDYMIQRAQQFSATLKMSSTRVIGAERMNNENLSGYHLGDGALYLYRTGREYADIFPLWDWRKLPGVTCPQTPVPPFQNSFLNTKQVGGVSVGDVGIAMLQYTRTKETLTANKAWFFCGDTIMCLGAGITGTSDAGIATSINQCILSGELRIRNAASSATFIPDMKAARLDIADMRPETMRNVSKDIHTSFSPSVTLPHDTDYIEHDGWRYTINSVDQASLRLEAGPVTGNWAKIFRNPETPKNDITRDIFKLWIDHGKTPENASYAYAITLAGQKPSAKIIQNTSALQVVQLSNIKPRESVTAKTDTATRTSRVLYGIVFWTAGKAELSDNLSIAADQSCLVLFDPVERTAHIAEPAQKLTELTLTYNGALIPVKLPSGSRAGSTIKISVTP